MRRRFNRGDVRDFREATEARQNSSPGRARISRQTTAQGRPDVRLPCIAPVLCVRNMFARESCGCQPAPGLPCALSIEGAMRRAKLGRNAPRGGEGVSAVRNVHWRILCCPLLRHCERSEAIQSLSVEGFWIASSQGAPRNDEWRARVPQFRYLARDIPTIVARSHRSDKKSSVDGCAPHLDESTLVGP
jgi:hypothetical protein